MPKIIFYSCCCLSMISFVILRHLLILLKRSFSVKQTNNWGKNRFSSEVEKGGTESSPRERRWTNVGNLKEEEEKQERQNIGGKRKSAGVKDQEMGKSWTREERGERGREAIKDGEERKVFEEMKVIFVDLISLVRRKREESTNSAPHFFRLTVSRNGGIPPF